MAGEIKCVRGIRDFEESMFYLIVLDCISFYIPSVTIIFSSKPISEGLYLNEMPQGPRERKEFQKAY